MRVSSWRVLVGASALALAALALVVLGTRGLWGIRGLAGRPEPAHDPERTQAEEPPAAAAEAVPRRNAAESRPRPRGGAALAGRVTLPGGEPVAGARVRSSAGIAGSSDEVGRFELSGLPPGEYWLWAAADGLVARPVPPVRLGSQDVRDLVLVLEAGGELHGTVRDLAGEPVAGARVEGRPANRATPRDRHGYGGRPAFEVVQANTGADGRFVLAPIPVGDVELIVKRHGYAGFGRVYSSDVGELDLALTPLRAVFGHVVDASSGAPVAFDRIRVQVSLGGEEGRWVETDEAVEAGPPPAAEGSFRLWPATRRPVRLLAEGPGFAPTLSEVVGPGDHDAGPIVLVVEPGLAVQGRVVERVTAAQGVERPGIAGASVALSPSGPAGVARVTSSGRTDEQGEFALRVAGAGPHMLIVDAPGYLGSELAVELAAPTEPLLVALEPAASLRCHLDAPEPAALPALWIQLRRTNEHTSAQPPRRPMERELHLTDLPAGTYMVELFDVDPRHAGGRAALTSSRVELVAGEERSLSLRPAGTGGLRGQLRVDGAPAPLCRIEMEQAGGGAAAECTTDRDGRFAFQWLTPGIYELTVGLEPGTPRAHRRRVEVMAGPAQELSVELTTAALKGRILRAEDGRPVAGAEVRVEVLAAESLEPVLAARLRTDPDGRFSTPRLTAGRALVSVVADGLASVVRKPVDLAAGLRFELSDLVLAPGGSLTVRLLVGARGSGSVGALSVVVRCEGEEGPEERRARRTGYGSVAFEGLRTGRVEVAVLDDEERVLARRNAWVHADRSETVLIELE